MQKADRAIEFAPAEGVAMKPLPRLGGAVLLLLSTSGCAAVQSRFNDPARNPEQAAPARSSGWFGSRLWSRAAPTPASASSPASKAEAPEPEADRPTTPETEIWPGPQSSGRSRLLPMLGNRDRTKKPAPSDDFYPTLSSASAPTAMPAGATDRQVRPARDDEAPADAWLADDLRDPGLQRTNRAKIPISFLAP